MKINNILENEWIFEFLEKRTLVNQYKKTKDLIDWKI